MSMCEMDLDAVGLKHGTDKSSNGHNYLWTYGKEIAPGPEGSLLELGWWEGDSVRMWREWLPEKWTVTGLDIEDKEPVPGVNFVPGSQDDRDLADDVAQKYGPFDVIVDDASHVSPLTIKSFQIYWPHVKPGGLYFIEDLHVSYHRDWAGYDDTKPTRGHVGGPTPMQFLKRLTDDVHYGHGGAGPANPRYKNISSVRFWPGLCLVVKSR